MKTENTGHEPKCGNPVSRPEQRVGCEAWSREVSSFDSFVLSAQDVTQPAAHGATRKIGPALAFGGKSDLHAGGRQRCVSAIPEASISVQLHWTLHAGNG